MRSPEAGEARRVLSMTGFGAGEAALEGHALRVELRAVNHRHLDVRVRVPSELSELSNVLEDAVRAQAVRGRIEAHAVWRGPSPGGSELDVARAREAYQQLTRLRDALTPGEPVPLTMLLSVPGLFVTRGLARDTLEAGLRAAVTDALRELAAMRAREGDALANDLLQRVATLRAQVRVIEGLRPGVVEAAQRRLVRRVEKLLEGTSAALDPARVAQEAAWFADKSDVAEELTRLDSHLDELARSLQADGESIGRKLEFVVQEIGRELNTLGAKANDAEISRRVVDMKTELERIREQVQNIL